MFKAHLYWVRDVEFSSDSKFIASGDDDNLVKIWDLDGNELMRFIWHLDWILKVRFSEDDKFIISGSFDYSIKIWSLEDRCEKFGFYLPNDSAYSLALVSNGKYIGVQYKIQYLMVFKISYDRYIL